MEERIAELEHLLHQRDVTLKKMENQLQLKEDKIKELSSQLDKYEHN